MESDNGRIYREASTHIRRTSYRSYFMEQEFQSGYMGPELGSVQLEHFRIYDYPQHPHCYPPWRPYPPLHPCGIQDLIQIEIEKERIREEIIRSEIARRCAEVRREMIMKREWAYRKGSDGLIYGLTQTMGFNSPTRLPLLGTRAEQCSSDERTVLSLRRMERPSGRYETTSGRIADLRNSDFNPVLENDKYKERIILQVNPPVSDNGKEKERIVLQAKPNENISGSKRKAETLPLEATESLSDDPLRKKVKTEWICAICRVSVSSKQSLKDHLRGKKHKSKEAAIKVKESGKNYCMGFCLKKDTKPIQVVGTPVPENGNKLTTPPVLIRKAGNANSEREDTPKLQNQISKDLKENAKAVVKNMQKNKVTKKEKCEFWCEMSQVGALDMNSHRMRKKHVTLVQHSNRRLQDSDSTHKEKRGCSRWQKRNLRYC